MRVARLVVALGFVTLVGSACGEAPVRDPKRPQTAAARTRIEKAESDEEKVDEKGKKWGGWRYQGRRDDCFFLVKRKCFQTRADACAAAKCGKQQCVVEGGGPAQVRCEAN